MRTTVTLTKAMASKLALLSGMWGVSKSEAMRRIFGLGSFVADTLEDKHEILVRYKGTKEMQKLVFPEL